MKLAALLCAGIFCLCAGAAQSQDAAQDRPPVLRCGKVKFVSEKGQPLARQAIGLMWIQVDWDHPPATEQEAMKIPTKARKELKTNDQGEISIPVVKGGPYLLEFLILDDRSYPEGHFQSAEKPESCVQSLEVRGQHVVAKPTDMGQSK
jgi:hypothetical protein